MRLTLTALMLLASTAWALDPTLGAGSLSAPGECLTLTTKGLRVALSGQRPTSDFDPRVARPLIRGRHLFACVVPHTETEFDPGPYEVRGAFLDRQGRVAFGVVSPWSGTDCVALYLTRTLVLCAP